MLFLCFYREVVLQDPTQTLETSFRGTLEEWNVKETSILECSSSHEL